MDAVVFITGASSGIGEHLAREYVKQGARVALVARRADRLAALVKELGEQNAIALTGDVCKDGDLEKAVEQTVAKFGRIDVAIANAGVGGAAHFTRTTLADFRQDIETNVFGALRTAYAVLPELQKTRGSFSIVSSVMAYLSLPGAASYTTSKAAAKALAESLRVDLAAFGVNVTHIAPGFIDTELRRHKGGQFSADAKDPVPQWMQMPAPKAARKIISAIRWRRRELVLTWLGKIGVFFARHFSGLTAFVLKLGTKQGLKIERV